MSDSQADIVVRFQQLKSAARALGLDVDVIRRINHIFIVTDRGTEISSAPSLDHIDHFLRGVEIERRRA